MSQKKLQEIKSLIDGAETSLQRARDLLSSLIGSGDKSLTQKAESAGSMKASAEGQVIEGVFDGQNMIGPDGKQYSIPANYASKSKLVEGDLLKLTIDARGNFIYKQIGPIERSRLKGKLARDDKTDEWRVLAEGKAYQVLLASVTYFKGEPGDEVVVMVPRDKASVWAAVENIIKSAGPEPQPLAGDEIKQPGAKNLPSDQPAYEIQPSAQGPTPETQQGQSSAGNLDELSPLRGLNEDFEQI